MKRCSVVLERINFDDENIRKLMKPSKSDYWDDEFDDFLQNEYIDEEINKEIEDEIMKVIMSVNQESEENTSDSCEYGIYDNIEEPTSEAIVYVSTNDEMVPIDHPMETNEVSTNSKEHEVNANQKCEEFCDNKVTDQQNKKSKQSRPTHHREYAIDQVVFAKVRGYRPWPAKVRVT